MTVGFWSLWSQSLAAHVPDDSGEMLGIETEPKKLSKMT